MSLSASEASLRRHYLALIARTLERWPDAVLAAPGDGLDALAQACRNLSARLNGREPLRVHLDPTPFQIPERVRKLRPSGSTGSH